MPSFLDVSVSQRNDIRSGCQKFVAGVPRNIVVSGAVYYIYLERIYSF